LEAWLTNTEAARYLGIGKQRLRNLRIRGLISARMEGRGRKLLYHIDDLEGLRPVVKKRTTGETGEVGRLRGEVRELKQESMEYEKKMLNLDQENRKLKRALAELRARASVR